jgi:hypothetical protein
MKQTFLAHLIFLLVGISNSFAQAQKPKSMILPSDNWSEQMLIKNESISNDQGFNSSDSIVYINSLKCKLLIRNKKEKSFEYTLYNECQTGACSGLENFEGEASTTDTGEPPYSMFGDPGVIKFTILEEGKFISAEPEPTWVGYDCAGKFNYSFELLTNSSNDVSGQILCYEGSGGGPCFNAAIIEETKELKLYPNDEVSVFLKFSSKINENENIYTDGISKVVVYTDGEFVISIKLLTRVKLGDEEIYDEGSYSIPAD